MYGFAETKNTIKSVRGRIRGIKPLLKKRIFAPSLFALMLSFPNSANIPNESTVPDLTNPESVEYYISMLTAEAEAIDTQIYNLPNLDARAVQRVVERSDDFGKFMLTAPDVRAMLMSDYEDLTPKQRDQTTEDALYAFHIYPHLPELQERAHKYNRTLEEMIPLTLVESSGMNPEYFHNQLGQSAFGPFQVMRLTYRFIEGLMKEQDPMRYQEYRDMNLFEKSLEAGFVYFTYLDTMFRNPAQTVAAWYAGPGGDFKNPMTVQFVRDYFRAQTTYNRIQPVLHDLLALQTAYEESRALMVERSTLEGRISPVVAYQFTSASRDTLL